MSLSLLLVVNRVTKVERLSFRWTFFLVSVHKTDLSNALNGTISKIDLDLRFEEQTRRNGSEHSDGIKVKNKD